uniref:Suppressor of tumorigenicity 14 protein homolog n=1 Tax=Sinocyclocheilus grahami TaxID=75366 RepID=A0A672SR97_SINGR
MTHERQHRGLTAANLTNTSYDMEPLKSGGKIPTEQFLPASDAKKLQKKRVSFRAIVAIGLPTALAIIALVTGLLVWHFHYRYNGRVRKMFSGYLTISSQTFSDAYENSNTIEYKELASRVSRQLKGIYGQVRLLSKNHVASSVQGFSEGSNNGIIAYYLSEFNVRESQVSAVDEAMASMDGGENARKSRRGFGLRTDNSLIIDGMTSGAVDARLAGRNLKRSSKRSHHAHGNQTDIIRSPGFPDSAYLPNLYTEWQIRADPEHRIRLEFDVLDLEKDCRNDFIKVYDSLAPSEKQVIAEICGEKPPKTVYTIKSNQTTVRFHSDLSYVSEGFSAEFEAFEPTNPCPGRFQCDNDLCVSPNLQCDGYNDCGDMSDERGCTCNETQIKCKNGFCKPSFWRCDGVNDCGDNTDEENCGNCKAQEFRCRNNRCIPAHKQCNGYNDCGDGSDESQCEKSIAVHCSDLTYKCKNNQCISKLNPMCDGEIDCADGSDEAECKCGTKPYKSSRIVGGKDSSEGEWPWQVSLHMNTQGHVCGASVISNRWLVTAAHCVQDSEKFKYSQPDQWEVYLGLLNQGETSKSTLKRVKRIISHPQYDHLSEDNDMALMELDSPVTLSQNIWPVCLPEATHDFPAGKSVWITGWGKQREEVDAVASVLQKAEVRIINNTVCNKLMDDGITPRMICAGVLSGGVDACQGDSGGPMISTESSGRMFLAGVVSWGDGCGRRNRPGVYTRVTEYRSWIRQMTGV